MDVVDDVEKGPLAPLPQVSRLHGELLGQPVLQAAVVVVLDVGVAHEHGGHLLLQVHFGLAVSFQQLVDQSARERPIGVLIVGRGGGGGGGCCRGGDGGGVGVVVV